MNPLPFTLSRLWFPKKSVRTTEMVDMPPLRRVTQLPSARTIDPSVTAILNQASDMRRWIDQLRSNDADVARDAATTLGAVGDRSAVPALIEVLLDVYKGSHPVTRCAAAIALGKLRDWRASGPLVAALADAVPEVGEEAAAALGNIGEAAAIDPLLMVAGDASGQFSVSVRRAAIRALSRFRSARASSLLLTLSMDRSEDPAVRQAAQGAEA